MKDHLTANSQLLANWDLGWGEESLDKAPSATNGHRGESFEPVTGRHLGICVEPDCQRFEGLSVYAALVDPLEQMLKKRSRDVLALNLWHQEPA